MHHPPSLLWTSFPCVSKLNKLCRLSKHSRIQCPHSIAFISSWHGSTFSYRSWSSTCSHTARRPSHSPLRSYPPNPINANTNTSSFLSNTSSVIFSRPSSSASNQRWATRQKTDRFAKEAKVANLKSRAAFKLLQINERYRIFRPGQTVVDLGFAPGSWSQVAIEMVRPGLGRVIGVDLIPVAPPKGVNAIQGDFLSVGTQERVRELLCDENAGRVRRSSLLLQPQDNHETEVDERGEFVVQEGETSYVDQQQVEHGNMATTGKLPGRSEDDEKHNEKCVDVVLSDMSAPWEILTSSNLSGKNSLSNPYYRMMNTSGNRFKDHAGSMDLCRSALYFAYDTLKIGGHFVCKFYQGAEDKIFEKQLKAMFHKVHREKPESSRAESKEAFFVGIRRLAKVDRQSIFDEGS